MTAYAVWSKLPRRWRGSVPLFARNMHYEKDLKTVTLNVDEILGFYTERHPSKQQEELLP